MLLDNIQYFPQDQDSHTGSLQRATVGRATMQGIFLAVDALVSQLLSELQ